MAKLTRSQAARELAEMANNMVERYCDSESNLMFEYGNDDEIPSLDAECDRMHARIEYLLSVLEDTLTCACCEHYDKVAGWCVKHGAESPADGYCSWAERRTS